MCGLTVYCAGRPAMYGLTAMCGLTSDEQSDRAMHCQKGHLSVRPSNAMSKGGILQSELTMGGQIAQIAPKHSKLPPKKKLSHFFQASKLNFYFSENLKRNTS